MDYTGKGIRLRPGELEKCADTIGVTQAHIKTVIDVETAGKGFDSSGHPIFLFEPHKFYQNVPKEKKAEAIRKGLAYPTWKGPGSYPKTPALRWTQFVAATELDETAAISSASWGMGQIMGSEYKEAGYPSPQHMLIAFCKSEYEQVLGMCRLIKKRGLDKDLNNFPDMAACRHFALRYNGGGYEKNHYHTKLHDAYIRNAARVEVHQTVEPIEDGTIRFGDKDDSPTGPVRAAQARFKELGYSLLVDGEFGNGTRITVLAWKANNNMDTSSGDLSPADLEFLKVSPPMPVQAERATATVNDLKPTSPIIRKTSMGKKILGWFGGIVGTAQAADSTGLLDKSQGYIDKATQVKTMAGSAKELVADSGIGDLLHIIVEWKFPILCVLMVVAFVIFNKVQKNRLEMHQKAEIA